MSLGGTISTSEPRVTSLLINQSAYGSAVGQVWGTHRVPPNLLWYGDFKAIAHTQSQGGKGGPDFESTTYTYRAAFVMAISGGEIDGVGKVWADKEIKTLTDLGLTLKPGALGQSPWSHLSVNHPDEALGYSGVAYVCNATFELGRSTSVPNLNFEVQGRRREADGCAKPAGILADILTDPVDGLGLADVFEAGSLADFETWCVANAITLSLAALSQKEARSYVADILKACMADAVPSGGKLRLVPYGDEAVGAWTPVTVAAYEIDEGDLLSAPRIRRKQPSEAINRVTINIADAAHDYNTVPITRDDISAVNRYGAKAESYDLPMITRQTLGEQVADFWLSRKLYIRNEVELELDERFCLLEPMDLVTLTFAVGQLSSVPLRVVEVEEEEGTIKVLAEEWPFGVVNGIAVPSEGAAGYVPNLNVDPGNSSEPVVFEPPIALAGEPQIWLATSGGATWGGCEIWISLDNATYERIGEIRAPCRHGLLTATLATGGDPDTTGQLKVDLSVSGGQLASATQDARDLFKTACWVDGEIISYQSATLTASSAYTLTSLRRGAYGTPVASHASGKKFVRLDDAVFRYSVPASYIGKTLYIKLRSFNRFGGKLQELADLTASSYAVVGAPLGGVAGLALERAWIGRTLAVVWGPYAGPSGAYTYKVEIWSGGVRRRTVTGLAATRFETTIEQLKADGCTRTLELRVYAVSETGVSSAPGVLGVTNAAPAAPSITLYDAVEALGVVTSKPLDDDYITTRIWISQSAGISTATPPTWEGTASDWTSGKIAAGTWYVRAAHVDQFGPDTINASAETSIIVTTAAAGVPRVADASTITAAANSNPPGGDAYWAVWSLAHGSLWSWDKPAGHYINNADLSNGYFNLLTAMQASVGYLSVLSGSMGNVTIDANGWVRSNGVTGYAAGASGFFIGHESGQYKARVGSLTNMLGWDGTKLTIGNPGGGRWEFSGGSGAFINAAGETLFASGTAAAELLNSHENLIQNSLFERDDSNISAPSLWVRSVTGTPVWARLYRYSTYSVAAPVWEPSRAFFQAEISDPADRVFWYHTPFIAVDPGQNYHLSMMARRAAGQSRVFLGVWTYDSAGVQLSTTYVLYDYDIASAAWSEYGGVLGPAGVPFPSGTVSVRIVIVAQDNVVGATWITEPVFCRGTVRTRIASSLNKLGYIGDADATFGAGIGTNLTRSGAVVAQSDFVASWNKLSSTNIGTFMTAATIGQLQVDLASANKLIVGEANIADLSVGTLKVKSNNITTGSSGTWSPAQSMAYNAAQAPTYYSPNLSILLPYSPQKLALTISFEVHATADKSLLRFYFYRDDVQIPATYSQSSVESGSTMTITFLLEDFPAAGTHQYKVGVWNGYGNTWVLDKVTMQLLAYLR